MKIVSRPINIGKKVVNLFPPAFYPSINNFTWYFWGNGGTKNQVFSFQTYLRSESTCKNKCCFMTSIIVLMGVEIAKFSNYERISKLKKSVLSAYPDCLTNILLWNLTNVLSVFLFPMLHDEMYLLVITIAMHDRPLTGIFQVTYWESLTTKMKGFASKWVFCAFYLCFSDNNHIFLQWLSLLFLFCKCICQWIYLLVYLAGKIHLPGKQLSHVRQVRCRLLHIGSLWPQE